MYIYNDFLHCAHHIGASRKQPFLANSSTQPAHLASTIFLKTRFSEVLFRLGNTVVSFFTRGVPMLTVFARRANRKLITKVMMALALSVCNPSLSMATPNEVRESEVGDCRFLGKVEGSSGYGKNAGWQPLAKASALHRAEKLGASHVVWEQMYPVGVYNGIAVARAYSCNT